MGSILTTGKCLCDGACFLQCLHDFRHFYFYFTLGLDCDECNIQIYTFILVKNIVQRFTFQISLPSLIFVIVTVVFRNYVKVFMLSFVKILCNN